VAEPPLVALVATEVGPGVGDDAEPEQPTADRSSAPRTEIDSSRKLIRGSPCGIIIAGPAPGRPAQLYGNCIASVNLPSRLEGADGCTISPKVSIDLAA